MNYRSYEWKIIYVFILVFMLIEVGSYVVLTVSTERIARERVRQDLQTPDVAQERIRTQPCAPACTWP